MAGSDIHTEKHKLSHMVNGEWVEHSFPPAFALQVMPYGPRRLVAGVPGGDPVVFDKLIGCLTGPFFVLYILHTPRGEGEPGRYQSQQIDSAELQAFLGRFSPLLTGDARHDLWIHSPGANATLVWERHNLIYAYGPLAAYAKALRELGFEENAPLEPSFAHSHHYREDFDGLAREILTALDWRRSALQPEDEQFEAT